MRHNLVLLFLIVALPILAGVWLIPANWPAATAGAMLTDEVIVRDGDGTIGTAVYAKQIPTSPTSMPTRLPAPTDSPPAPPSSPTPTSTTSTPLPTAAPPGLVVGAIVPNTVVNSVDNTLLVEGAGYVDPVRVEIVGSAYGLLDATIGGHGISLILPAGFPAGTYGVVVHNGDGTTGAATNMLTVLSPTPTLPIPPSPVNAPTSTPVPTKTPEPTRFLRPLLIVQSYGASSATLSPGQDIDFELTLESTGVTTARNIVMTFVRGDLIPRVTGGVQSIRDLAAGDAEHVWQPFTVKSSLSSNEAVLNVQVEYTDDQGTRYTASFDLTFPVKLPVSSSTATPTPTSTPTPTLSVRPQIIIESYSIDPNPLYPGAVAQLHLELVNASGEAARQVVTSLEFSQDNLLVLVPLSSNRRFTEELDAGERVALPYDLAVAGDAAAGLIPINVLVSYSDDHNNTYQDTNTIGLRIEVYPAFLVTLYQSVPDVIRTGDSFDLPIRVINIGQEDVNVNTIEVTSDQFTITNGVLYLGPLYASASGSLLAHAEASKAGTATVTVTVNYLDGYQRPQKYTHELTFKVQEYQRTAEAGGGTYPGASGVRGSRGQASMTVGQRILQAILGFLGLATRTATGAGGGIPQGVQP
jgi:hypothetical protein